jgi:hypothetical protein
VVVLRGATELGVTAEGGASVVVATVDSVVGSVAGSVVLVVSGSVVEVALEVGTSVLSVGNVGEGAASEGGGDRTGLVADGTVAEGEVTDPDAFGNRVAAFPPPPQAAAVPARTTSNPANQRRPRCATPVRRSERVEPASFVTWPSSRSGLLRWFASPASKHYLSGLAPPDTGETAARGSCYLIGNLEVSSLARSTEEIARPTLDGRD